MRNIGYNIFLTTTAARLAIIAGRADCAQKGHSNMTNNALLKKLEAMLAQAERERMYGQITLEIKDGKVDLLRKNTTEKIESIEREQTRHGRYEKA